MPLPTTDPQELYGLPLERFTDERNALAKRLREEGRRDEASEVAREIFREWFVRLFNAPNTAIDRALIAHGAKLAFDFAEAFIAARYDMDSSGKSKVT